MAKGDHDRGERRIDEQMKQSQGYLTGVQSQLGGQYNSLNNMYYGGTPQFGNVYGYGSTVPHYSIFNQPQFSGNGTDTPMYNVSPGQGATDYRSTFDQMFPSASLSPQQLAARESELNAAGFRLLGPNAAGMRTKIELPNGQVMDVIQGAGAGHNVKAWQNAGGGGLGNFGGGIIGQSMGDYSGLQGMLQNFYGDIGSNYQNLMSDIGGRYSNLFGDIGSRYDSLMGDVGGKYNDLIGRYKGFAETGGYTPEGLASIRSRTLSPIRASYENAERELSRNRALQGGYAPGMNAGLARMARERGQLSSDAATNAEAQIEQMIHAGKLAGMAGMGNAIGGYTSGLGSLLGGRTSGQLGALGGYAGSLGSLLGSMTGNQGNALSSMASLYGTTPGLANMFGNQMLQSMQQQLGAAGLQNQLGLGFTNAQQGLARVPGNFENAVGIGKDIAGIASDAIYPWML